jgi:2-polyprenyl-3-methyl-5-hydroxy-6-metoxy-1,4-benzoquinol methylase
LSNPFNHHAYINKDVILTVVDRNPTRGSGLLENFLARQRSNQANKLITPHYRSGRILDIGCGRHPLFLAHTSFSEKFGLDKTVDDASQAFYYERGIRLIDYDIEAGGRLPFDAEYFNVVTMLAVYEHLEQESLQLILGEVHRVLRPGGFHIATTPITWTDVLLRCMARLRLVNSAEIDEHKECYTPGKIVPMLQ